MALDQFWIGTQYSVLSTHVGIGTQYSVRAQYSLLITAQYPVHSALSPGSLLITHYSLLITAQYSVLSTQFWISSGLVLSTNISCSCCWSKTENLEQLQPL